MKKLLFLMGSIGLSVIPSSTLVSCGNYENHDSSKIYLSNFSHTFFEKLEYLSVEKSMPEKANIQILKVAILRSLETWEHRIDIKDFDKELKITFYNENGQVISESQFSGDVFYYQLEATDNSHYFHGQTERLETKIANIKILGINDENSKNDDKNDKDDRTNLNSFNDGKINESDTSKNCIDLSSYDGYSYSDNDGNKLLKDVGYLKSVFKKNTLYFNNYQVEIVKMSKGIATVRAKDTSDRYKGECEIKYKSK